MKEICPICEQAAELVREHRTLRMGRRSVAVEQEFYRCSDCQEDWFTPDQMDQVQKRAAHQVRQEEGLLDPDSIREIRERFELSQADFERLLGFGPKTVGRWERGTVFPNQSSDLLMRLVAEFPEVARFLAHRHGVELPADGAWQAGEQRRVSEPGLSEAQAFRSTAAVPKSLNEVFRPSPSGFAPLIIRVTAEEGSRVS